MDDVFTVSFACTNCGEEWEESYPAGVRVTWDGHQDAMASRTRDCTEIGYRCDCCNMMACPNCELKDTVEDVDRQPTGEAVEE